MRLGSLGARTAAVAAGLVCTTTCQVSDALRPAAIKDVALAYAGDSVLVVAMPVTPKVTVTVDGAPLAGARLLVTSSDTETVAVRGDTLVPKRRGGVTLTVTLQSSALPRNPPSLVRPVLVVADTVTLDSTAVRLTSLGDTVTLVATARDALGAGLAGVTSRWSSSDTTVVTLAPLGRLTARANGTATVRAMVDRDTAMVTVTVAQQLTRWTFEPAALRIEALSDTATVVATGHDPRGSAIAALAPAAWSVRDATIATTSAAGQVTSVHNGATWLVATRGSVKDSVAVTVAQRALSVAITPRPVPAITSLGAQTQLTARSFDRRGIELQAATPIWFTLDPGRVRVTSDGLVTALATGTAHVVASLDAGADTATVTITNDPATVTVSPDSATATSLGDTLVFRAVARNGRGDSVAATVVWRTPDSAVVSVDTAGRAVALAVGTARVIALVGSRADTSVARVTNVPTRVDITPATRTYTSLGDMDTLPVAITNARGAALPRGAVTWSSDDQTIARVSTSGVVTAKDTGQTVVRATSGAVYDSVVVTVQNLPASIVVNSPAVDTLTAIGQTLVLPADVRNARGAQILNFPVAWRSTNRAAVDTVLPTGAALAIGWGSTNLIAQAGAAADTVKLTVQNPTRLYVSNALFTGLRVGTPARPYAKIQDAVAAADAGDTVIVLRGVGAYSESVNLARRVVILGDSAAFVAGGRNPALLPLLAHDTGAAAITANTTAPVTVRYLAIRHTLDGPAFASNGSDVQLEWLYVNAAGISSRIGRGISVSNSQSGTILRHLNVRMVRGYGISLINSSTAQIASDSIIGVDSIGVPEGGAGISIRGGTTITVQSNVLRATRGPRILVRGGADATITGHVLSGRHPLIQLDSVTGIVHILGNTFQVGVDPNDTGDDPDCAVDPRCAGIVITESRNGALAGGLAEQSYTSPAEINSNTFYNMNAPNVTDGVGIRLRHSMGYGVGNEFRQIATALQLEGVSKGVFQSATADTCQWMGTLEGTDSLFLANATTHQSGVILHQPYTGTFAAWVVIRYGQFSRTGGDLINIWNTGAYAYLENATFRSSPYSTPIIFNGNALILYEDSVLGVGDSIAGYTPGGIYNAAVSVLNASQVSLYYTWIRGFPGFPGLQLFASVGSFYASQSVLTQNKVGLRVDASVPSGMSLSSAGNNSVFDNFVGGLEDARASGGNLSNWWWGDGRGPRGAGNLAATGDSVLDAPAAPFNPLTAPPAALTGTVAAGLRQVRGTGQTALHGTALPKALTARVVDASGLPVAGVSVTFTVTAGGGSLAGLATRTVTTNADGLAETSFTLGPAAGANAVSATGSGLNTVFFSATGT